MVTSTRTSGPGVAEVRAEINVTPLVDVCLVLLIIFMVVTPLINDAVTAAGDPEPGSDGRAAGPARGRRRRQRVRDGRGQPGDHRRFDRRVRAEARPGRDVVIKADRAIPYGRVREVMLALSRVGIGRVGLVTRRIDRVGSES